MLKMLIDPMGGIVMTNDGNAILREIDCNHPTAKSIQLYNLKYHYANNILQNFIFIYIYII